MNRSMSRSVCKITYKTSSEMQCPRNPPIRRKRPDEPFQRNVLPKLTPSYDMKSKKISTFTVSSKTTHTAQQQSECKPRQSVPSRGSNINSGCCPKKENERITVNLKALSTKVINQIGGTNTGRTTVGKDDLLSLQSVKKNLTGEHFEEFSNFTKKFDMEQDSLLCNLGDLFHELTEGNNPLFEEGTERIQAVEQSFEKQRIHQKEELQKLTSRIQSLEETQNTLSYRLEEKKNMNIGVEKKKNDTESTIFDYNKSINKTKCHLNRLTRKNENLNTFILNVEEAIRKTKSKINFRQNAILSEEKNVCDLKGVLLDKKRFISFTPSK